MVTNKGKIWMCRVWPHTWLCHEDGYEPGVDWHGSPIYLQAWQEVLPTNAPSIASSDAPSLFPSNKPSLSPSIASSDAPSSFPSNEPSVSLPPSNVPSETPSSVPSDQPSASVSVPPSTVPSDKPSLSPSDQPSVSVSPSTVPSASPSQKPSTSFMPSEPSSNKPSVSIAPSLSLAPTNAPFALICPQTISGTGATQLGQHLEGVNFGDQFGSQVAISEDGTTLAVQALHYRTSEMFGQVTTYRLNSGRWDQIGQTFTGAFEERLGTGLSLSSDGSILAMSTDAFHSFGYAKVYKYDEPGNIWTQMGSTISYERNSIDHFGASNSLSADGTILAIGAPQYGANIRDQQASNTQELGLVKVYQYNTSVNTWAQLGDTLYGEKTTSKGDLFGWSVSLSDDGYTLAVGAPQNDGNGSDSGHVRMFEYDGTNSIWVKRGDDIDGEGAGDWSGQSVSLSSDGSKVAIMARLSDEPAVDSNGNTRALSGQVRVFESDSLPLWTASSQVGDDIDLNYGDDGIRVSLSGDGTLLALGTPQSRHVATSPSRNKGFARLYKEDSAGNWVQQFEIQGQIAGFYGDNFGKAIVLSSDGKTVAIGAPGAKVGSQSTAGRVCVYQVD